MADQPAKSLQASHDREVRQVSPPRGRLQRALQRVARPRGRPRRHERAPPGHPLEPDPRRGRDDRRQGLAPEGHRPGPRRRAQRSPSPRRRQRVRDQAPQLHLQGQPQSSPQGAARGAQRARRSRLDRGPARRRLHRARHQAGGRRAGEVGRRAAGPDRDHRRRGGGSEELPQPAPRLGRHRQRRRRGRDHRPPVADRLRGRPRGARRAGRRGRARQRRGCRCRGRSDD